MFSNQVGAITFIRRVFPVLLCECLVANATDIFALFTFLQHYCSFIQQDNLQVPHDSLVLGKTIFIRAFKYHWRRQWEQRNFLVLDNIFILKTIILWLFGVMRSSVYQDKQGRIHSLRHWWRNYRLCRHRVFR